MAGAQGSDVWPGAEITLTVPTGVALVLYELIERYYDAAAPELKTDRAEWYALVQLSGALERNGVHEVEEYDRILNEARRDLSSYDGIPF
jgi:hypothetical protein